MRKKGFIFITVVIVFLFIMLSIFYTYEIYKPGTKDDTIESRIRTMNDFINDLTIDTERAAYISGFRSLIAMEEYVSETGEFLADAESVFIQAFLNGSIGNFSPVILNQSTFSLYIDRVNQKSDDIDIILDINISSVDMSQSDPFTVLVEVHTHIVLNDSRGLANWEFNETFQAEIPISNFKDPLYSVNTLGRFPNFVIETNITEFVVNNITDNLIFHIDEGFYKNSTSGPSFVQRFEGDVSSNPLGIESLVDLAFLQDQDITVDTSKSVVDYIYFGNQSTNNKCSVQNMPSWFKIDENHLSDYEIDELTYINCT